MSRKAGPLVELREVVSTDVAVFYEHQLDREAARMAGFTSRDATVHQSHWATILADASVVARTVLVDGEVAGNVVCWSHHGVREVGYWIGREHWGRGVATAALGAFLRLVTERPLVAHVVESNVASRRVLEKCGFVRVDAGTEAPADELAFRLDG